MGRDLTNLYISESFNHILQISGSDVQNGVGVAVTGTLESPINLTVASASYAVSASHEIIKEVSSSYADFAQTAQSASHAVNSDSASYVAGTNVDGTVASATSSSYASTATSSSHAVQADNATTADSSTNATYAQNTITTGKNLEATEIAKGTPLYFTASGTSGNIVGVYRADAGNANRMPAGGIAGESIAAGAEGTVLLDGYIGGVNTNSFNSGDKVYVAVGGGFTNVAPTGSSNLVQFLGNVEKKAINGSGVIQMHGEARNLPNLAQNFVWKGDANGVPQAVNQNTLSVATAQSSSYIQGTNVDGPVADATTAATASSVSSLNQDVSITGSLTVSGSNNLWITDWPASFQTKKVLDFGTITGGDSVVYDDNFESFYNYLGAGAHLNGVIRTFTGGGQYYFNSFWQGPNASYWLMTPSGSAQEHTISLRNDSGTTVDARVDATNVNLGNTIAENITVGNNSSTTSLSGSVNLSGSFNAIGGQFTSLEVGVDNERINFAGNTVDVQSNGTLTLEGTNVSISGNVTGSSNLIKSASAAGATITFEKFDGTTFDVTPTAGAVSELDTGAGVVISGSRIDVTNGTIEYTGSLNGSGSFNINHPGAPTNTERHLFDLPSYTTTDGATYPTRFIGLQNYPAFGQAFEGGVTITHADPGQAYNYYSELNVSPNIVSMLCKPSSSATVSGLAAGPNADLSETYTYIYADDIRVGNNIPATEIKIGANSTAVEISGSLSVQNTINGEITNATLATTASSVSTLNQDVDINGNLEVIGTTNLTGSFFSSGSTFNADVPNPANNTESHLFDLGATTTSDGASYPIRWMGQQNYGAFGQAFEDAWSVSHVDPGAAYGYYTELLVGPNAAQMQLKPSGSGTLANFSLGASADLSSTFANIFGNEVNVGHLLTQDIQIGNGSSSTIISGSVNVDQTITGTITNANSASYVAGANVDGTVASATTATTAATASSVSALNQNVNVNGNLDVTGTFTVSGSGNNNIWESNWPGNFGTKTIWDLGSQTTADGVLYDNARFRIFNYGSVARALNGWLLNFDGDSENYYNSFWHGPQASYFLLRPSGSASDSTIRLSNDSGDTTNLTLTADTLNLGVDKGNVNIATGTANNTVAVGNASNTPTVAIYASQSLSLGTNSINNQVTIGSSGTNGSTVSFQGQKWETTLNQPHTTPGEVVVDYSVNNPLSDSGSAYMRWASAGTAGERMSNTIQAYSIEIGNDGAGGSAENNSVTIGTTENTSTNINGGSVNINGEVTFGDRVKADVNTLTITSQTASLDASLGNFFDLALVSGSDTHVTVSNITAGQSYTLKTSQDGSGPGTITFNSSFKFAGGTPPTATANASAVDVYTFVSFDGSNVLSTQVADLQ